MKFINVPNLPQSKVRLVLVDERIDSACLKKLSEYGVEYIKVIGSDRLYEAVRSHPDMWLHHIGSNDIVYAPGLNKKVIKALSAKGFNLICGNARLKPEYPFDVAYNAVRIGNFVFHNLKYTDQTIKEYYKKSGLTMVHVEQGYSKCSIAIVDSKSIITSDKGIAVKAKTLGFEVLKISIQKKIILPGLNYGFIGGCSGLIAKDVFVLTGDIRELSDAEKIINFIEKKGIKIVPLSQSRPTDYGSILPLLEE